MMETASLRRRENLKSLLATDLDQVSVRNSTQFSYKERQFIFNLSDES
jgi:hypothetical protein